MLNCCRFALFATIAVACSNVQQSGGVPTAPNLDGVRPSGYETVEGYRVERGIYMRNGFNVKCEEDYPDCIYDSPGKFTKSSRKGVPGKSENDKCRKYDPCYECDKDVKYPEAEYPDGDPCGECIKYHHHERVQPDTQIDDVLLVDKAIVTGDVLVLGPVYHWYRNRIPYQISNSYSADEKRTIQNAITTIVDLTCFELFERTDEIDYVAFVHEKDGCSSYVGKIGGRQIINLSPCCLKYGVVLHELLHTIGYHHEHARSNRDSHITIETSNILPGRLYNFYKIDNTVSSAPYDFNSIMHFGPYAFTNGDGPTIVAKQGNPSFGQLVGLSSYDRLRILHDFCRFQEDDVQLTCPVPVCRGQAHNYPHANRNQFYTCALGQSGAPTIRTCFANLHFDEQRQQCRVVGDSMPAICATSTYIDRPDL